MIKEWHHFHGHCLHKDPWNQLGRSLAKHWGGQVWGEQGRAGQKWQESIFGSECDFFLMHHGASSSSLFF